MMRPRPRIDVHLHLHDAAPAFMQSATRQRFNVLASIDPRAWLPGRTSKVSIRFAVPDGTPADACECCSHCRPAPERMRAISATACGPRMPTSRPASGMG